MTCLKICAMTLNWTCKYAPCNVVTLSRIGASAQCRSFHYCTALRSLGDSDSKPAEEQKSDTVKNTKTGEPRALSQRWKHFEVAWGAERSRAPHGSQGKRGTLRARDAENRLSPELLKLRVEDFAYGRQKAPQRVEEEDVEIVFGVAPCLLALTQGRRTFRRLYVKEGVGKERVTVQQVCREAQKRAVPIRRCSRAQLDGMSGRRVHQGLCLEASPLGYLSEGQYVEPEQGTSKTPLWLVLDGVQDPMNLGAILRSAYFLGVDRIASSLRNSCPLTPVVSKASSGVMEIVNIYGYDSLVDMLKGKMKQGWQVVGSVGAEDKGVAVPIVNCSDFQLNSPTVLLMGGEGRGLSPDLLSLCHALVTIAPRQQLHPAVESLNVSVAAGSDEEKGCE